MNCSDKNARDKIINVYSNDDNRLLLIVWELVEITGGNEEMIEKILVNTDNHIIISIHKWKLKCTITTVLLAIISNGYANW